MTDDPTKIEIDFDPTVLRMSGVARHGYVRFDVPFISNIEGNLWQGGCETGLVLPEFIEHLVSLYPWENYAVNHELKSSLTFVMYDSTDQEYEAVDSLARWVADRCSDGPTLVHCQAGLNRSSLVAARVLMFGGRSASEAIALVRERRSPACLCNPAFETWLLETP